MGVFEFSMVYVQPSSPDHIKLQMADVVFWQHYEKGSLRTAQRSLSAYLEDDSRQALRSHIQAHRAEKRAGLRGRAGGETLLNGGEQEGGGGEGHSADQRENKRLGRAYHERRQRQQAEGEGGEYWDADVAPLGIGAEVVVSHQRDQREQDDERNVDLRQDQRGAEGARCNARKQNDRHNDSQKCI